MAKLGRSGLVLLAAIAVVAVGRAQSQPAAEYSYPPMSGPMHQYYDQHPDEFQQLLQRLPRPSHDIVPGNQLAPGATPTAGSWTSLTNPLASTNLSNPILLTDGTVIAHVSCAANWYKFTPDNTGNYINGTWSAIASLPAGYGPRFFGSGVLPDGRVVIEGGEYNGSGSCGGRTTKGAIYDPVANTWTSISPPAGWGIISDAAGIVLANGSYMQTSCCDNPPHAAVLNASTLTWTNTGTGKFDVYDEESMALLPDGTVLTVDAYVLSGTCGTGSERYDPNTGAWTSAGSTIAQQSDCSGKQSYEAGPIVMRPNGTAMSFSGVTTGTPQTAIFTTGANTWAAGPSHPLVSAVPYTMADAPAAVLPNGNVLVAMSPSNWATSSSFPTPIHWFEVDITNNTFAQMPDKTDSATFGAWEQNLLVLPNGQIMAFTIDGPTVQIYTPAGTYQASWQPTVTSVPTTLGAGCTYVASGTQFNGLTEGAYYGDDTNASTNFPLVRIVNNASGHVFYGRSYNHSSRSIAPSAASSTSFQVAAATETGASMLYVVANGIPSAGTAVTVGGPCPGSLAVTPSTNIAVSGPPKGPYSATSFQYQLSASPSSVNYSITGVPSWLNASFTSGTATASPVTVTFSLQNVSSLSPGVYAATIGFTNTTNGMGNTTRSATLTVTPDCALMAGPIAPPALIVGDPGPAVLPFPDICFHP